VAMVEVAGLRQNESQSDKSLGSVLDTQRLFLQRVACINAITGLCNARNDYCGCFIRKTPDCKILWPVPSRFMLSWRPILRQFVSCRVDARFSPTETEVAPWPLPFLSSTTIRQIRHRVGHVAEEEELQRLPLQPRWARPVFSLISRASPLDAVESSTCSLPRHETVSQTIPRTDQAEGPTLPFSSRLSGFCLQPTAKQGAPGFPGHGDPARRRRGRCRSRSRTRETASRLLDRSLEKPRRPPADPRPTALGCSRHAT